MSDLREVARRMARELGADLMPPEAEDYRIEKAILEGMKAALGPADDYISITIHTLVGPITLTGATAKKAWNAMAEARRKSLDADETVRRGK